MRHIFLSWFMVYGLWGQTLVGYNPTPVTTSNITANVTAVAFVMPCGATSYTNYRGSFLACQASYPENSTFTAKINGATDWRKFVGQNGHEFTISKKVATHRISDVTILPSSAQAGSDVYTLSYYILPPFETEAYDFASPNLPQTPYLHPDSIYTLAHYVNCYRAGLVLNCGESVNVPVSNRVAQTYYFDISTLGNVNGKLRVHFSDSSVPDYVYTTDCATGVPNASVTNQVEQMVSLVMQARNSGVTATVTFTADTLVSGTVAGIGIVAVGMGGQNSGFVNPALLPQEVTYGLGVGVYGAQSTAPDSSVIPPTTNIINVAKNANPAISAANLQKAIDAALSLRGRWDIVLPDGFYSNETIFLKNPGGRDNNWIVIRPATLPTKILGGNVTYGERVTTTDIFHAKVFGTSHGGDAITSIGPAHHFAVIGLELSHSASQGQPMYQVVALSNPGSSPAAFPHNFIFERNYIHGIIPNDHTPRQNAGLSIHGFAGDVNSLGLYGNYFSWFANGNGQEGVALFWAQSAGPITIVNNYFEASDEDVICCSDIVNTIGHTPVRNITFNRNYVDKNRAGIGLVSEKNGFEVKSVEGLSIVENVFEHSWNANQAGQCIALNAHSNRDFERSVSNVLIENNFCHAGAGMTINLREELMATPHHQTQNTIGASVKIYNNIFFIDGVQAGVGQNGSHYCFNELVGYDLRVDHNSCLFNPADDAAGITDVAFGGNNLHASSDLAVARTVYVTNNKLGRRIQGDSTDGYQLFPFGINATNNIIGRPEDKFLPANREITKIQGTSWYWAALPVKNGGYGNPRQINGLTSNYFEGCLLSQFLQDQTCVAPSASTYPNPSIGADEPSVMRNYCIIKTGNRPDIACSVPVLPTTPY